MVARPLEHLWSATATSRTTSHRIDDITYYAVIPPIFIFALAVTVVFSLSYYSVYCSVVLQCHLCLGVQPHADDPGGSTCSPISVYLPKCCPTSS